MLDLFFLLFRETRDILKLVIFVHLSVLLILAKYIYPIVDKIFSVSLSICVFVCYACVTPLPPTWFKKLFGMQTLDQDKLICFIMGLLLMTLVKDQSPYKELEQGPLMGDYH